MEHFISLPILGTYVLIPSSHLQFELPNEIFPWRFLNNERYYTYVSYLRACYMLCPFNSTIILSHLGLRFSVL